LRSTTGALWLYIAPAAGFLFNAGTGPPSATYDNPQRETDQAQSRTIYTITVDRKSCMTTRLDVTPKTTEQNRIVRTDISKVEVTNNKKIALDVIVLLMQ